MATNDIKVLRIQEVKDKIGIGRSTIYDWINPKSPRYDPSFPKPIKLGQASVGWLSNLLDEWLMQKYEQQTDAEV